MATYGPVNLPCYWNTDADFQGWVQGIHDALDALGLVQTADTGQINPATVSKPSTYGVFQGYEVWRFADAHQSETPVFIKLEYGSSNGVANSPALKVLVGSGSDGAGALTGQLSTNQTMNAQAAKSADVLLPVYASGSTGELLLAFNVDTGSNQYGMTCAIERPKDSSDAPTAEGVLVSYAYGDTLYSQWVPASGSVPANQTTWAVPNPSIWGRSAAGEDGDVCPVMIPLGGVWRYSHLLVTGAGDFTASGTMTANVFGADHTYRSFDNKAGHMYLNAVYCGLAFRWE